MIYQIENEYGNFIKKYGDSGKKYIQWCADMAKSLNVNVPWIMCQQADAPSPMVNTPKPRSFMVCSKVDRSKWQLCQVSWHPQVQ